MQGLYVNHTLLIHTSTQQSNQSLLQDSMYLYLTDAGDCYRTHLFPCWDRIACTMPTSIGWDRCVIVGTTNFTWLEMYLYVHRTRICL